MATWMLMFALRMMRHTLSLLLFMIYRFETRPVPVGTHTSKYRKIMSIILSCHRKKITRQPLSSISGRQHSSEIYTYSDATKITPLRQWSCWSPGRCHRRIRSRSCGRGGTSFPRGAPWQQQQRRRLLILCCGRRCWESSCAFITMHAIDKTRMQSADVGSPSRPRGENKTHHNRSVKE